MTDEVKGLLFIAVVGFLIVVLVSLKPKPTVKNPLLPDTVFVQVPYSVKDTLSHAKIKKIIIHDTTFICKNDTVFVHEDTVSFAVSDTIWQDSSFFCARYYFPPVNKFQFTYRLKEKETVREVRTPSLSFKSSLGIGILAGYGYGLKTKTFESFIGLGVTFNF